MMVSSPIDYGILEEAKKFYVQKGFQYIEVPWQVSNKAMNVTRPLSVPAINNKKQMVASGEQSFLQMIIDDNLKAGKYCCITPCIREFDAKYDDGLHFGQFIKLELIHYMGNLPLYREISDCCSMFALSYEFFSRYLPVKVVPTADEQRYGCETTFCVDIDSNDGIELGSYGLRHVRDVIARKHKIPECSWVYGTGVALPRIGFAAQRFSRNIESTINIVLESYESQ